MGQLPTHRVQPTRAFLNAGVDYGGPVMVKQSRNVSTKAYIALFVCLSTKAIHLELVSSLTTQEFMAAFRRFTARRGKCANLYSDNGTNFVKANKEIQKLYKHFKIKTNQEEIQEAASLEGTQWHFIPPGAPHFGGLWEAGVKTVKYHLKRVIGETLLTFEQLYTLLVQTEAIVNSRPLIVTYDDSHNPEILTPSHFLIGESLSLIPDPDLQEEPVNKLTKWQLIQQKMQHFWKKWHLEYLHTLHSRQKWNSRQENVRIGMVVIIMDNNTSPLNWKMGVIEILHPGKDGLSRVVTLRTTSGVIQRPITKICILPIEDVETWRLQGGRNVGGCAARATLGRATNKERESDRH